ncbi:hypothetical protein DDZ18_07695 [Marinicauda salina]|uniref:Flagellar protein FliO/FliZ n=1 Tax=Marinicauda salina TaxID=2135793 RepID=A0A2U2BU52_9PROT|nr:flagellar biosynthetic protein FliO [Marinicauda salina]PWE17545.1 hypothetical protein DDZ18_07695 [Marinicauda salina]
MDLLDYFRYIAALVLVLGLLAGFAYILRRGWAQGFLPGLPGAHAERRMRIVESLVIDPRRRVAIVEVDDVEHVLLLGAANETLLDARPAPKFEPVAPDDAETGERDERPEAAE